MTKTKRQLRAEAVERLDNYEEWFKMHRDGCLLSAVLGENYGITWEDNRAALIELLSDDEHMQSEFVNCGKPYREGQAVLDAGIITPMKDNGIPSNAPEGDAVKIMRDCSAMAHGMWALRDKLGIDCVAGWQMRCLSALADMVERDYERLGYHHKTMNESAARLAKVLDERDELREENDSLREWKACYERMRAERDELQRQLGTMRDVTREFRDERDGWKAQAEQAQESYLDAKHDRDAWHERYVKLQGSSKVRVGSSDEITYGFQFFKYYKEPRSVMSGETLFDYDGNAVGWIVGLDNPTNGIHAETNGIPSDSPLDAQSRAEIEDMKRSRAVSGDLPQDADVDSSEGAKAAREPREDAREGEADTREKLEADIAGCINTDTAEEYIQFFGDIQSWLDRQAAITERHWMEIVGANANANVELKRQIDTLEANNAQLHTLIAELQSERDAYREKLGRAVDAAHEITKMMED